MYYIADLKDFFSEELSGDGDRIDDFISCIEDEYDSFTWIFEEGMEGLAAGVSGITFLNPLDVVFFRLRFNLPTLHHDEIL